MFSPRTRATTAWAASCKAASRRKPGLVRSILIAWSVGIGRGLLTIRCGNARRCKRRAGGSVGVVAVVQRWLPNPVDTPAALAGAVVGVVQGAVDHGGEVAAEVEHHASRGKLVLAHVLRAARADVHVGRPTPSKLTDEVLVDRLDVDARAGVAALALALASEPLGLGDGV